MVLHQVVNHSLNLWAGNIESICHLFRGRTNARTGARILAGIEFSVDHQSMLEVVDAHIRGFFEADRAKMSGDLQSMRVRGIDGSLQFLRRDEHVGFDDVTPSSAR